MYNTRSGLLGAHMVGFNSIHEAYKQLNEMSPFPILSSWTVVFQFDDAKQKEDFSPFIGGQN